MQARSATPTHHKTYGP